MNRTVQRIRIACLSLCLFSLGVFYVQFTTSLGATPADEVSVAFINVGQGDSALLQAPGGFNLLIDGGRSSAGPTVVAYLKQQGVAEIDIMLASHADSDHIGGLITVLQDPEISVHTVLYNGYPGTTATWANFAAAVGESGAVFSAAQYPQSYSWGETTAYVLNPEPGLVEPDQNQASVVLLLEHREVAFLFTGDIDTQIEATLVARGTPLAADVLKVAHHGSRYSTSAEFLAAAQPAEAVISVGANPYGHPTDETLYRLISAEARPWRTDQSGTLVVVSDGVVFHLISEQGLSARIFLPLLISGAPPGESLTP